MVAALTVSVMALDEGCFVELAGELDISTASILRAHMDVVRSRVLIDCRGLVFVDSVGLGELMRIANRVESILLARPSEQLRRVVELMGLAETLKLSRDVTLAQWRSKTFER